MQSVERKKYSRLCHNLIVVEILVCDTAQNCGNVCNAYKYKYRCSHNRLHTNEVSVLKVSLFRVIRVPRFEFGLRVLHADTTRKGYFKKGNSKID